MRFRLARALLVSAVVALPSGCGVLLQCGLDTCLHSIFDLVDETRGDSCRNHEERLVNSVEQHDIATAYKHLENVRRRCSDGRYRAAHAYVMQAIPAQSHPGPAQPDKPNAFPACLAHVERTGLPPWDPRFDAAIKTRPRLCAAEDLDDALAVVRHKLQQQCAEATQQLHQQLATHDVEGARGTLAGAHRMCPPDQLSALAQEVERQSAAERTTLPAP